VAMGTRQNKSKNTALGRLQNKYGGLKQFLARSDGVCMGDEVDRRSSYGNTADADTDTDTDEGDETDSESADTDMGMSTGKGGRPPLPSPRPPIVLLEGKVSKEFYLQLN